MEEAGRGLRALQQPHTLRAYRDVAHLAPARAGQRLLSQRGVLLRRENPSGAVLEATAVELRPQDVARFVPPAGYHAITLDQMFETPP